MQILPTTQLTTTARLCHFSLTHTHYLSFPQEPTHSPPFLTMMVLLLRLWHLLGKSMFCGFCPGTPISRILAVSLHTSPLLHHTCSPLFMFCVWGGRRLTVPLRMDLFHGPNLLIFHSKKWMEHPLYSIIKGPRNINHSPLTYLSRAFPQDTVDACSSWSFPSQDHGWSGRQWDTITSSQCSWDQKHSE